MTQQHSLVIYDLTGKEIKPDEIRTSFQTQVAYSFLKEYEKNYPQHIFSLEIGVPKVKRKLILKQIFRV